jgi:hypothetical protein
MMVKGLSDLRLVPDQQELEAIVTPTRKRGAFDHHAHALVAAHRIDGDSGQAHDPIILRQIGSGADGDDFATVVVTASVAQHVRTLEFTAVRAFVERFGLQRASWLRRMPRRDGEVFLLGRPFRHLFLKITSLRAR